MSRTRIPRRDFLKSLAAAAAAAKSVSVGKLLGAEPKPSLDAKGLPTAMLGKTGVEVPRIGLGPGSRSSRLATGRSVTAWSGSARSTTPAVSTTSGCGA
jgi:hypothetical protein